ncbi:MAG: carbohydrate ABC transporter permease [Devosia sp.]|jgi:multiple sugar transport system permease protein|nr:carbohydrate ABC transporter permease [Devosia sp.]
MAQTRSRSNLGWNILSYGILIFLSVLSIGPLLWMLLTSFKVEDDIVTRTMVYFPTRFTVENYIKLWNQSGYPVLVVNSLVTTTMTVAICLFTGTIASYAFSRYHFPGRTPLMLGYLVVRMFPAVLMIIPLFIVMRNLKLFDTSLGLAIAYTSFLLPLFVWMLKGFFDAAPRELESAARIDGSTRIGAMFRIVIPIARNGLVATCVFVAIAAWNEYLFALMLTSSTGSRTWPVGLQLMVGEFQLPWGMLAAGGIISIIPVIVLFALVQRVMVAGITAGAVKG